MNKILIIGNSGSGKSWLAANLSKQLQIHEINLDSVVWQPGGFNQKRPQQEIDKQLSQLGLQPSWVVEGVFGALAEKLIDTADTLLFLDMDWPLCERSLLLRGSQSAKQLDKAMAEIKFQELLHWASDYYQRESKSSRYYHSLLFDGFKGNKTRLTSREQVNLFVNAML